MLLPNCVCCVACCPLSPAPDTLTFKFGKMATSYTAGPDLISVSLTSCSGSGATATAKVPEQTPGPLSSLVLTNPGSGYAIIGREKPSVSIVGGGGSGLKCDITLSPVDESECIRWTVSALSLVAGGNGYADNTVVSLEAGVTGVTVAAGAATLQTARVAPTGTVKVDGSGTGAKMTPSFTEGYALDSRAAWSVTEITIEDGGSGYMTGDEIYLSLTSGAPELVYTVLSGTIQTDEDGVIVNYFINNGGSYWADTGVVESVTLDSGGEFYKENTSLPAIVPAITTKITQLRPSAGTGATLTPIVDSDPQSLDFGKILRIDIATGSGGNGYIAHELFENKDCIEYYSERSVVLHKPDSLSTCTRSRLGCNWDFSVTLRNDNHSATLNPNSPPPLIRYESRDPAPDCELLDNVMDAPGGITGRLTANGTYAAGVIPVRPQFASFTFRGKTQGGALTDGKYPSSPYVYPGTVNQYTAPCYQAPAGGWVQAVQTNPRTVTLVSLGSMCAAEGTGPVRECYYALSGVGGTYTEYNDPQCAVVLQFNCPCRYAVSAVSISEEIATGIEPISSPFDFYPDLWVLVRTSVWAPRDPIQVANNSNDWPAPSDYEWRLLYSSLYFRRYAIVGDVFYPNYSGTTQPFQYGYVDYGYLSSPDDLPAGENIWEKGFWDRVAKGYMGVTDIFPSGPPDIDWDIQWGEGNVPS